MPLEQLKTTCGNVKGYIMRWRYLDTSKEEPMFFNRNKDIERKAQRILDEESGRIEYLDICLKAKVCPACGENLSIKTDNDGNIYFKCTKCTWKFNRV